MDAAEVLGSAPLAELIVVPRGFGVKAARSAAAASPLGGVFVPAIVRAGRGRNKPAPADVVYDTPRFGGFGVLAVTADDVVLITGPRNKVHKVIGRVPRSEIGSRSATAAGSRPRRRW